MKPTKAPVNPLRNMLVANCALFLTVMELTLGTTGACAFEQDQRINGLTLQFGTDTFATRNAFGGAVGGTVQSQLQTQISSTVASGSTSMLLEMPGLADLTGVSVPSFK